jgi:hypothetical protein
MPTSFPSHKDTPITVRSPLLTALLSQFVPLSYGHSYHSSFPLSYGHSYHSLFPSHKDTPITVRSPLIRTLLSQIGPPS